MLLCLNRMGKSKEAKEHEAKLKRLEEAEEQLDQLFREIVQKPRDLSVRCRAGQALLDGGQEQNGVLMLMGILEEEPNTPAAHEALAKYYNRIGDAEKSRRHARFAP